jgi:hypothetical protein
VSFQAPSRAGLYLFADGSWVVENFTDAPLSTKLNGEPVGIEPRGWTMRWRR